jgi:hypothetical protein
MPSAEPRTGHNWTLFARWLDLLERQLGDPHTTLVIPFDFRVVLIRSLNCAEFSSWLSEIAQAHNPISGF